MLARLTKPTAIDFEKILVIPERPAAVGEAEAALQEAAAARQAGQRRHIEAGQRLASQRLGEPPAITAKEVDDLGFALAPLFEAETAAKAHRDQVLQAYESSIAPSLAGPIKQLRDAIEEAMGNLETVLNHGVSFKARAGSFDLAKISKLPGICPHAIERLKLVRAALDHANR
ncbi:hypothetical protein [Mesorhizobium wenxiniae]|uniref:Uncharacterized protein n=1 Tax=Mesorhizobium wenxiniae TaxID=2014805 RepID=A0A271KAT5_9HYPH|nr:hypothetical protein [Mesorhizobium wenxiniae]PAP92155.1 hypothetical protein CIT31_29815 [Mesorhizobium wenxiniae]